MSWAWARSKWGAAGSASFAIVVGAGLSSFGMGLLVPVLPAYATSLGANGTEVGLLLASLGFARLLISLPAAWLAQREGYRRLLIASPAVTVPAALLCALAGGFWMLAVFCLLEGAAAGTYALAGTATTMSAAARRRGRSLASLQGASLFGASLGPGIGGFVAQQLGIRALFVLYAALAAFVTLWLTRRLGRAALPASGPAPDGPREDGLRLWRYVGAPALLPLWLLAFMLVFTRTGAQLVVAPLLGAQRLGLHPQAIGIALTAGGFAGLAMLYPSGWLTDRFGWKATIVPGGLGIAAGLVLLGASASYAQFVGGAALLGLASGFAGPAPAAYLASTVAGAERAVAAGWYRMTGDAAAMVAPPLFGWAAQDRAYTPALVSAAIVLLGTVVIFTRCAVPFRPGTGAVLSSDP